jgi:transposase
MLITDLNGIPLVSFCRSAQVSEYSLAIETIDSIEIPQRPLHPIKRPDMLIADRGYDARWLRHEVSKRGIRVVIPKRRKPNSNVVPAINKKIKQDYAKRFVVERTFAWLQWNRRLTIRWDRYSLMYNAFLSVACILICLRRVLQ